jgi:glycosyltransferase involved in cell wall biosynthesis
MSKPKIDILLPYWGDFKLLKKTVESVIAQTEPNWRLMVFDDAYPTDEAKKYFKKLKDDRITYFRHKENIGITKNFNFSIEAAAAKYCIILGCDDIMLPHYVETALKHIGEADFYQPGVQVIDGKDQPYMPLVDKIKNRLRPKKSGTYEGEYIARTLAMGNWLYFPSITWKTKTLQRYRFDTTHDNTQDVILELNLVLDGGKLFVDNEVTFQYRRFADSWSSRRKTKAGGRFREEAEIYNHFAEEFKRKNWPKAARAAKMHITSRAHRVLTVISSRSFQ